MEAALRLPKGDEIVSIKRFDQINPFKSELYKLYKLSTMESNKASKDYYSPVTISPANFKKEITSSTTLVYLRNGTPIGMVHILDGYDGAAFLRGFIVNPKNRREGIGTALLEKCFEVARKYGHKKAELMIWANNPNAERLYSKHGFKVAEKTMVKHL